MSRRSLVIAAAIVAGVVLSRVAFATHDLWAWDSVLYARALERGFHVDFDLADQRPQPPGYILYLAFAWLFRAFLADSNAALVAVSIAASGLGAAALYLLVRRLAGGGIAVTAALAYAANPLVWTYGEIAYPYALLGFLSVTLASLFLATSDERPSAAARASLASFAFGLLAGFRQDLLFLLGPLWLWTIWSAGWRVRAFASLLAGAGVLIWLVPTALLSEGLGTYLEVLSQQGEAVRQTYSVQAQGAAAFAYNVRFTSYALAWGLLGFGVPLVGLALAAAVRWFRAKRPVGRIDRERAFFGFWLVPGLLFYVYVHIGEWGYVLSVLPGLYVLTAVLVARGAARLPAVRPAMWRALAASAVAVPAMLFLLLPARFSAQALAEHDGALTARVAYVRDHFDRSQTIILAREDFLLVRYYLPEYRAWLYDPPPYANQTPMHKRAMNTTAIVIFTDGLVPRENLDVRYVETSDGVTLAYVQIEPGAVVELYGDRYMVQEPTVLQ